MTTRLRLLRNLAVAALIVMAVWQPVLRGVAAFMAVRSPLERADFIVPIYGDRDAIPAAVLTLYKEGLAPRILLYRFQPGRLERLGLLPPVSETWRKLLEAQGLPGGAIHTIPEPLRNHRALGGELARLAGPGRIRVIVVAPKPFSRVVRNTIRRGILSGPVDLVMHPVTSPQIHQRYWWQSRAGVLAHFDAYVLWTLQYVR